MNPRIRNPHPFDMSDFYNGKIVVVGGHELDRGNLSGSKENKGQDKNQTHKLDWSFLKKKPAIKRLS